MRRLAASFVVASPTGARIRTRLRLIPADERVLRAVGEHLGRLAGQDLAVRCRLGAVAGDDQRTSRKRALTAASSSRWAGAITRTSSDQWQRAQRNLLDARDGLRRACRTLRSRLAVPVGGRQGRVRGYASQAERFQKQGRLQQLEARLAGVEQRLAAGRVSVCRGGRRLAKRRHATGRDDVAFTQAGWRERWQAARRFLTADGETGKSWGNETIRVHPDEHWLELRLPTPLAHLASRPHGRYRLAFPVTFSYRAEAWRRRRHRGRSPTPSGWMRHGAAGTWTRRGGLQPTRSPPLQNCGSTPRSPSTSTPATWLAGRWMRPATPWVHRTPSPWTWAGSRRAPETADSGRRRPMWSTWPASTIAARSWSRTSTSPTLELKVARPWGVAGAASGCAALWRISRPAGSGIG